MLFLVAMAYPVMLAVLWGFEYRQDCSWQADNERMQSERLEIIKQYGAALVSLETEGTRILGEMKGVIDSENDILQIIDHGRKLIRERSEADGEQWERMNTFEETGP